MLLKDPISIDGPLGQTFLFTRHFRHNDLFGPQPVAFLHDRVYAKQNLYDLARYTGDDPFNYRLHDVWQLVFQKPWTCPRNVHELVNDLADKIHGGDLFVYLEQGGLERARLAMEDSGPVSGDESSWWDTAVGAAKGFTNDLIRRNAAMNTEWMAEKGIVQYRDTGTGKTLTPEEVGLRYEQDGKDYFALETPSEVEGAEMAGNSQAALLAAEAVMLLGSRGRNAIRDPKEFTQDLTQALTNSRSETEALGKAGLEQAKRRMGHTTDPRYVDRYHGPDDMTCRDGCLTEWEAKGNSRDSTSVAEDVFGLRQGSRGKNFRRANVMTGHKARKVGQFSGRQGGPYTDDEIGLWSEVRRLRGNKDHLSVHTNTTTGTVRVFQRDSNGEIVQKLDEFEMENFDPLRNAIKQELGQ